MISACGLPVACVVVDCAPAVIVVLPGCDWNNDIALVKSKNPPVLVRSFNDHQSDKQNATYFQIYFT